MNVLTGIKAREVEYILITCKDNLNSFTETISSVFPEAATQVCVEHKIRNSCLYLISKDLNEFLPKISKQNVAVNKVTAALALDTYEQKMGQKISIWCQKLENKLG